MKSGTSPSQNNHSVKKAILDLEGGDREKDISQKDTAVLQNALSQPVISRYIKATSWMIPFAFIMFGVDLLLYIIWYAIGISDSKWLGYILTGTYYFYIFGGVLISPLFFYIIYACSKNHTFLKAVIFYIPLIFIFYIFGFQILNRYEIHHNCTLEWNKSFSLNLINCIPKVPTNECIGCKKEDIMKPLILLYPEAQEEIQVELEYTPGFSATFPEYDNSKKGWSVTASPDGTLLDHSTMMETYGLFWEGNGADTEYDLSKGLIVKGSELREFLYEKLTDIGLNTKEKSDFIMYWYPKLQEYPYVQITFAGEDYNQSAPLKIIPKPDSILRVFMVAKPLKSLVNIDPQKLEKFERKGFSVVEWGGTIVE